MGQRNLPGRQSRLPLASPDASVACIAEPFCKVSFRRKYAIEKRTNVQMIEKAKTVLHPRILSGDNTAGEVACALQSASGNIYLGVCIDIGSGIGFCAEHSAIAAMITAGESSITKIVAVCGDGVVLPPCGRCREFMYQIDSKNYTNTEVILGLDHSEKLKDLLPHPFDEVWNM
jgi:cytidine deaminase